MSAAANPKQQRPSAVQRYLDDLCWDGTLRLSTWLTRYLGAPADPTTARRGMLWLIGGVARAMQPGCKVDQVLVLHGPLSTAKGEALRRLAPPECSALMISLHPSTIQGKWIIDLDFDCVKARLGEVRAFLSRSEDIYRAPYQRAAVSVPRACIFAVTCDGDSLPGQDRRFWPVACGKNGVIDVAAIEADRDQIWAEAALLYHGGAVWWDGADYEAKAGA